MRKLLFYLIPITMTLAGCEKEGLEGKNSLVNMTAEEAGENCSCGGIKVETGLDLNCNSILDSDEIQETVYICNGNDASQDYVNYISKISQTGTLAPTGDVLENSMNLTITWVRESTGTYLGTFNKSLDLTKTIAIATPPSTIRNVYIQFVNDNSVRVKTEAFSPIYFLADDWEGLMLEIKEFVN